MHKLGLGFDVLREVNPALIYCAVSGYGLTGPDAGKGGFDLVAQGISGLMRITGEPGGAPTKVGSPVTDINAGILAALGIVSAYVHRLRTGEGQLVDTSLLEAGVMQTFWQSAIFLGSGRDIGALGSAHPLTAPYQAFETQDGWITIGGSNQANFARLTQVLDAPELLERSALHRQPAAYAQSACAGRTAYRALQTKTFRGVARGARSRPVCPAGPVLTIAEMLAHPQVRARDMVVETRASLGGRDSKRIGCPIKFSTTPARVTRPAPRFGEHTEEVLLEFGFAEDEIRAMLAGGAAAQHGATSPAVSF